MPSTYWKIKIGDAAAVTFASLDLQGLAISGKVQATSTATFRQVKAYDSDPLIDYLTTVKIYRSESLWFQGLCTNIARHGNGDSEYISYQISDPWWQLENVIYQQTYNRYVGGVASTPELSRIILGADADGSRLHSGEVITAALNYALTKLDTDALYQIGTIDVSTQIPYEQLNAQDTAAIIKRCLRWNPDTIAYFDYTTEPATLHVRKRSNLASKSIALADGVVVSNSINPQYATQKDGVVIQFERTDTIDGNEQTITIADTAGDTSKEFKTLRLFIDLVGASASFVRQEVVTETFQISSATWWKKRHAKLHAATDISVSGATKTALDDGEGNDGTSYTKELRSGSIAKWMAGVGVCEQIIEAEVTYTPSGGSPKTENLRLVRTGTNANNQVYSTLGDSSPAEDTPVGLAAAILASINTLQYAGSITLTESEAGSETLLNKKINLTGGRAEWETMNAQPSSIEIDIETGTTKLDFGPAQHLAANDLFQLLRNVKDRKPASGALRSQIGGTSDLPTRSPSTYTADDSADTTPAGINVVKVSNSSIKVTAGQVHTADFAEVTVAATDGMEVWIKATLPSEGAAPTSVVATAIDPGADTTTTTSRKWASIAIAGGILTVTPIRSGSPDLDSCGSNHIWIF